MDLGLKGKAALITGGSDGIGAGIAEALSAEGAVVAICARNLARLEATAARIEAATGNKVVPIAADLRSEAGCSHFVADAAAALGRIDILVNNAGASKLGPFVELTDEEFVDAVNGKFLGTVRCCRAVIPHMQALGGGVIVNITGANQQAVSLHSSGGSSNAAIRMFSKVLSQELGPMGIRVNSLAPGRIQTSRAEQIFDIEARVSGATREAVMAKMVSAIPSGRLGRVSDIADMVCFLVSDRASYVNGAAIMVDGSKSAVI